MHSGVMQSYGKLGRHFPFLSLTEAEAARWKKNPYTGGFEPATRRLSFLMNTPGAGAAARSTLLF